MCKSSSSENVAQHRYTRTSGGNFWLRVATAQSFHLILPIRRAFSCFKFEIALWTSLELSLSWTGGLITSGGNSHESLELLKRKIFLKWFTGRF